jgi:hypothetical protein
MRGRRPKPTRIKALTGNPGKRPLNLTNRGPSPRFRNVRLSLAPSRGGNGCA